MAKTVSDKKALAKYLADYLYQHDDEKHDLLDALENLIAQALEAYESINNTTPAKDKRIRTIEQLKELAADPNGLDCYILLNGALRSSKQVWYYPDDKTFHVFNSIDSSEQDLTEEEIISPASSNFAEAMLKGALISER